MTYIYETRPESEATPSWPLAAFLILSWIGFPGHGSAAKHHGAPPED